MPKSKKKKNQDFQKVKLKVGRRLQKADNVTNASFKSRSVQVVQHIKTGDGSEPTTRRNLNITDLLNQCQHYSTSVRLDAVGGLRELLSSHPEVLQHYLSQIIDRVSQLVVDKDAAVRSAVIKLFRQVISQVDIHKMRPFFPVISAHVCCAMTHIYDDIQSDSLNILDIFLEFHPSLIVERSSQIIPNFIEQISHQNAAKKSSAGSRSLNIKPDGKIQAHRWRNQVLSRLSSLLSTLVHRSRNPTAESWTEEKKGEGLKVVWREEEEVKAAVIPQHFQNVWTNPGHRINTLKNVLSTEMEERGYNLREPSGVLHLLETLVPILLECWVEATAIQHKAIEGHLLSAEACCLRLGVVKTILLLLQYARQVIQVHWESSVVRFLADFQQHFLKFFPYSAHSTTGPGNKKVKLDNVQNMVHSLNITICDIMSFFLTSSGTSEDRMGLCHVITQYLQVYLSEEEYDSSSTQQILQVIERLTENCPDNEGLQQLLSVLVSRFTHIHHISKEKKLLLHFFSRLIIKNRMFIREDARREFLDSLTPLFKLCVKNSLMSEQILEVLCDLTTRSTDSYDSGVTAFVTSVLELDLNSMFSMDNKCLRSFIELVYRVPQLSRENYRRLRDLIHDERLPVITGQYLLQVLQQRYDRHSLLIEEQGLYIQFLFMCAFDSVECPSSGQGTDWDRFTRTVSISQTVSEQLSMFPNTEQVVELLCCFLDKTKVLTNDEIGMSIHKIVVFVTLASKLKIWSYPISSAVTEDVLGLIWGYLLMVTETDVGLPVNTLIAEEVTEKCQQFISAGEQILQKFLRRILQALSDSGNVEEVQTVQRAAILILHRDLPWPIIAEDLNCQPVMDDLEKIEGLASQHGWKKLKNLLLKFNNKCIE